MRKFLLVSFAFVSFGFAGEVDQFLNSLGVTLSSPHSVDAQARGYYFGGGASYKAPSAALQPFQVVPPSIRSGCGGIDITFGSLSYLEPDYFINFAQQVISQASGFAFDIALDIMCPQCSSIMKKLTALANQINAMSMNSCQLLANLSNRIKSEVLNNKVAGGGSEGWIKAIDDTLSSWSNTLGEFNNYLSALGCNNPNCYLFAGYRSIADRFVDEMQNSGIYSFWNTTNMKYMVRAIFGDIIKQGGTPSAYICVSPDDSVVNDLLKLASETGSIQVKGYDDGGNATTVFLQSVKDYVSLTLGGIVGKIINRQPLTAGEINFLAQYDIPALGILKILAPSPSALLVVKDILAEYLAYELTYQFVAGLYGEYAKLRSKVKNLRWESPDMDEQLIRVCVKEFIMNSDPGIRVITKLQRQIADKKSKLIGKLRFALDLYEMERFVYSKYSNNPLMASYVFGSLMR